MLIRFHGGPWDGEERRMDEPLPPTWQVPVPQGFRGFEAHARHALRSGSFPDVGDVLEYRIVEYERTRRLHGDGRIEVCYVERKLLAAELEAQRTADLRDQLTAETTRLWGSPPDLRTLVEQPNLRAWVWTCGDECECGQAQVIGWTGAYTIDGEPADWPSETGELVIPYAYTPDGRRYGAYVELWRGRFLTDGAPGCDDDLRLLRRYLDLFASDIATRIRWPKL